MLQQRWRNFNAGNFNNQNASQPRAGAVADGKKAALFVLDSFRKMHLSVVQQRVRIANWMSAFCGHMAHATTVSLYWEFQVELRYSSWVACKNMKTCPRPRRGNVEETEIQKSRQTYAGRYRIWSRRTETRPQKRDDRTQQDEIYKTIWIGRYVESLNAPPVSSTTLRRKCTETVGENCCATAQWRSAEVCGSKNVIG